MSGLVAAILKSCVRFGPKVALSDGTVQVSYSDLGQQIDAWNDRFSNLGPRSRVGFILVNRLEYVPALFGAIKAGVVPFMIDPGLPEAAQRELCDSLGLNAVLADPAKTGWIIDADPVTPGLVIAQQPGAASDFDLAHDTVLCRFTTGTSGVPKCLEFNDNAVLCAAEIWAKAHHYNDQDVVLCLAAFFNGLAFNTCFSSTLLTGGTLLTYPGLPAASPVIRYATQQDATRLIAFPAFYQAAAKPGPVSLKQSRVVSAYSAASRLLDETRLGFQDRHALAIVDYYGLAEAGPVTHEPQGEAMAGNGVPLPGCELRCPDGLLEVKTPYMVSRYLNQPGVFESRMTDDGFLRTQDRATLRDGRLFLTGRADTVIDIGGRKFDPSDTVTCLVNLPGITDAFVFGAQTREGTQEVRAAISGITGLTTQDIRRQMIGHIEGYKIPRRILSMGSIPRNGAGKPYAAAIMKAFEEEDT